MLSDRLRRLREDSGLKQEELSDQLNIGVSTLRLYEAGKRTPPADVIVRICHRFSVSADFLLGLSGPEGTQPVEVPDNLRADASAFMKAAADLCELEAGRSFYRSVIPIYKAIAQSLAEAVKKTDERFAFLLSEFPEYADSEKPGELPEDLRLKVLAQVAAGTVDPDLQRLVKAGKEYGDDVQKYVSAAVLKVTALIQHGILNELVAGRSLGLQTPPAK